MPITYIPAISYTFAPDSNNYFNLDVSVEDFNDIGRPDNQIRLPYFEPNRKFKLNWWTPESIFNYKHLMVTAFYEIKDNKNGKSVKNSRERLGIHNDNYYRIMGDSGGFQVISKGWKGDPLQVLEWQENECYWGFTLDIPPIKKVSDSHKSHTKYKFLGADGFKASLLKTASNSMLAYNKRTSNLRLLYSLQGFSRPHFEFTRDILNKKYNANIYDFDGAGLGIKKSNKMEAVAYNVLSCLEVFPDLKHLHLFGVSGLENLIVAIYCLRHYLKKGLHLTYDSSTPLFIAKMLQSYMILGEKVRIRLGEQEYDDIDYLPCNCPVCALTGGYAKYMKSSTWDAMGRNKNIGYTMMALHNLHHIIGLTEIFNSFSTNEEKLRSLITVLYKDSENLIREIDRLQEYGLDDVGAITRKALSQNYASTELKNL